jgi:hypothetical protein
MPILGIIASSISGKLSPNYATPWVSNVVRLNTGTPPNINIVSQGGAAVSAGVLVSGGSGNGLGTVPSWWTQDQTGAYTQKRAFTGLTNWFLAQAVPDDNGNVYIATGSGAGDIVAAKINSSGTVLWAKNVNGGTDGFTKVSPDGTRTVHRSTSVEVDKFVVLDGSNGSVVYARQCTSRSVQNAYLYQISNTKIYSTGYERDGSNQGFIRQYTLSSGNQDWSLWYNDGQPSVSTTCFYDSSGNVYFGGYHNSDNYFVKLNSSGTLQWARSFGGGQGFPQHGAVDSAGNVYVGYNNGTLGHLVKFNSSGTVQWQRYFAGSANPGSSNSGQVTVLNDDRLFVTFSASDGTGVNAYQVVIPTDGSKTGSYSVGGKTINYQPSSLSISSKGGTMSASQSASSTTMTVTDAGLGTLGTWTNTTGLTNI